MHIGFRQGRDFGVSTRGGMGFGFRGSSPAWPYAEIGRGGLPRCGYFSFTPVSPAPYSTRMTREEDLNFLKSQAETIKGQLEEIEARIRDFEVEK